jgi:fatty acid desaturase
MAVTEPTDDLREQARARLKKKQDLRAHALVFVLFNAAVWVIWLLAGSGFPWPIVVSLLWGVGLVMNAWDVYGRRPITEADVQREVEHLRR